MEIKISTKHILNALLIIAWLIFVGLSIEAGGFITNTILPFVFETNNASNYWNGLNLSDLYEKDAGNFVVLTSLMIIASVLKAILFYQIIKLLQEKKLDLAKPFNQSLLKFISICSYVAIGIGIFSHWGKSYASWLENQNINLPNVDSLRLSGADVWIFMGIIFIVISYIIKKGIELQTENDLTI